MAWRCLRCFATVLTPTSMHSLCMADMSCLGCRPPSQPVWRQQQTPCCWGPPTVWCCSAWPAAPPSHMCTRASWAQRWWHAAMLSPAQPSLLYRRVPKGLRCCQARSSPAVTIAAPAWSCHAMRAWQRRPLGCAQYHCEASHRCVPQASMRRLQCSGCAEGLCKAHPAAQCTSHASESDVRGDSGHRGSRTAAAECLWHAVTFCLLSKEAGHPWFAVVQNSRPIVSYRLVSRCGCAPTCLWHAAEMSHTLCRALQYHCRVLWKLRWALPAVYRLCAFQDRHHVAPSAVESCLMRPAGIAFASSMV